LDSIISKELEQKSITWFQNSNQYLVLEPMAASIIKSLSEKKEIKEIAAELEKELDIPFEKAIDFILDLEEKILKPNLEANQHSGRNKKNYTAPKSYGYTKYYLIHSKIFKIQFSNEFEVSLIHPKFAHLEILAVLQPDVHAKIFNHGSHTFLVIDNELIGSWERKDIHYFQGKFSMKIIENIYDKPEKHWMGVFHASAVAHKKNSVCILGDSGNGKSTSLALLQAHGFHCIADDFVPIDNQKKVHAFPAGISIKKKSLSTLLAYYPELENSAEFHFKRLDKVVRFLPPKEIDFDKTFPCNALIFIKYTKKVEFECERISSLTAFQSLIPDSWISQKPKNVRVFLDWFSSLPCYQLTYSNNQKMIDHVGSILRNEL
jgi:hypothetical protein